MELNLKNKKIERYFIGTIFICIVYLILAAFLTACSTPEKATKKVQKIMIDYPEIVRDVCPHLDTIFKPSPPKLVRYDSIINKPDTTGLQAWIDLVINSKEIDKKAAIDSCNNWWLKHPKVIRIISEKEIKVPYPVADKVLINDAYNKGKSVRIIEYKTPTWAYWSIVLNIILIIVIGIIIYFIYLLRFIRVKLK